MSYFLVEGALYYERDTKFYQSRQYCIILCNSHVFFLKKIYIPDLATELQFCGKRNSVLLPNTEPGWLLHVSCMHTCSLCPRPAVFFARGPSPVASPVAPVV